MRGGRGQTGFERRRERGFRNRERSLHSVRDAERAALEQTRFWQFRRRKRIRRDADELQAEVESRFARFASLLGQREAQMPFVRAFKGIHTQRDRYGRAQDAASRIQRRHREEQEWARAEADRMLAEMDAE